MSHFNQAANTWDTPEKKEQNRKYAEEIKMLSGKREFKRVLEVGCGTGLLGENFIQKDNQFLGVDTSEGMLEILRQKFSGHSQVKAKLINMEKETLNEGPFDLIISSMAFHHLQNPEGMLKILKTKLVPDGVMAIIDLDREDGTFHPDPVKMGVHHFGFDEATCRQWADASGLRMERKIIHTIHKNDKNYPIFLSLFQV